MRLEEGFVFCSLQKTLWLNIEAYDYSTSASETQDSNFHSWYLMSKKKKKTPAGTDTDGLTVSSGPRFERFGSGLGLGLRVIYCDNYANINRLYFP